MMTFAGSTGSSLFACFAGGPLSSRTISERALCRATDFAAVFAPWKGFMEILSKVDFVIRVNFSGVAV
jgi:hypothetical protein